MSNSISANDIQQTLIKTIRKTAEKSVQQAEYDKTVLATVQFCTDISIGQYKIKYQNGYFTAYAQDTSIKYSNGASVFITIPKNNLNNRLLITGLATNDSNARTYLTNYEGDQQYSIDGTELIYSKDSTNPFSIGLSTYRGMSDAKDIVQIYSRDTADDSLIDFSCGLTSDGNLKGIATVDDLLKKGGGYIRLGATFQTNIPEGQRFSGNYGVVLQLRFFINEDEKKKYLKGKKSKREIKEYALDIDNMTGTPFDYFIPSKQYAYFQIDKELFDRVEGFYVFARNFNGLEVPTPIPDNIFIKELSLFNARKIYEGNNDKYKAELISVDGFTFEATNSTSERKKEIIARLRVDGNIVTNPKEQKVKFYWALEDSAVNEKDRRFYNKYTGIGWRCLNKKEVKEYDSTQELPPSQQEYIIIDDSIPTSVKSFIWKDDSDTLELKESSVEGKINRLKCVIVYNNTPVEVIENITNENGIYLSITSSNGTEFYGGIGDTTLTVGAFKDLLVADPPEGGDKYELSNITLTDPNMTYKWTITNVAGRTTELPPTNPQQYIIEDVEEWLTKHYDKEHNVHHDDETIENDAEVNAWLAGYPDSWARCLQRYNYYNTKYNTYKDSDVSKAATCKRRLEAIEVNVQNLIKSLYTPDLSSNPGFYILGPSDVEARYDGKNEDRTVEITKTTPYYYGSPEYSSNENFQNTLMYLTGSMIGNRSTLTVSAIKNGRAIASESIILKKAEAVNLDYSIEIVNGTQTFLYDNSGKSPASKNAASPMTISPLYFKLYDKEGVLLYDSQDPDSPDNVTDLTVLKPKWIFRDPSDSLIQTRYKNTEGCELNFKDPNELWLNNKESFIYTIAEKYNRSLKDTSNIVLEVNYSDQKIRGTTNFTFTQQGELGTNGTDSTLDIEDPVYEKFKNDALSSCTGSVVMERINGIRSPRRYSVNQRHLKNGFLYATKRYARDGSEDLDGEFVNLQFARGVNADKSFLQNHPEIEEADTIEGGESIELYGTWKDKNRALDLATSSKWSTIQGDGYTEAGNYRCGQPSFKLTVPNEKSGQTDSSYAKLALSHYNVEPPLSYKPTLVTDYPKEGHQGGVYHVATNTVELQGYPKVDDTEKDSNIFAIYGYYPMPYFYYNSTRYPEIMKNINPATRIVVVGGFDEVIYDSAGRNPQYDKQQPFKVFIFNELGEDITERLVEGTGHYITWSCSDSLKPINTTKDFVPYGNFTENVNLLGKYTTYDGRSYKCIVAHTKSELPAGTEFEYNYWEEVSQNAVNKQIFEVAPPQRYETVASNDLFNSWVSVKVHYYDRQDGYTIDAEALIPINIYSNRYGSEDINDWDGKKSKVEDGYIISSKVAAGKKYEDNSFCGVTIGENFYTDTKKNEVGLFAYGRVNEKDPESWSRTAFLDAKTGRLILGPSGGSQIVLNPKIDTQDQVWSRLNGWYISGDYFYKPIGEGLHIDVTSKTARNTYFTSLSQGDDITPPSTLLGSVGMYCPFNQKVNADDVFLWASSLNKDLGDEIIGQDLKRYKQAVEEYGVLFTGDGYVIRESSEAWQREKRTNILIGSRIRTSLIIQMIQHLEQEGTPLPYDGTNPDHYYNQDLFAPEQQTIENLTAKKADSEQATAEAEADLAGFESAINTYKLTYNRYRAIQEAENGGYPTSYKNNQKKSNFYVTYGGHLHATSADIEGHLVANSGRFGNGSNKVEISIERENKKYILYNKNFYIEDTQGEGNDNVEVYMKGTIRAKGGQFGQVGDNVDGDSSGTVFIEYDWAPWRLPSDSEPWDDEHFYVDKLKGLNTKYALYHKNFYVKDDGEVFFNGKLFTEEGRVGNWVIKKTSLHSYDGKIDLSPSDGITAGKFYAKITGEIGHSDREWKISSEGIAEFNNVNNKFTAQSYTIGSGQDKTVLNGDGISLARGQSFNLNNFTLTANDEGFTFTGKGRFDGINITGGNELTFSGGNQLRISSSAILLAGGSYNISSEGTASLKSLRVNGKTLDEYIEDVVSNMSFELVGGTTSTSNEVPAHYHGVKVTSNSQ